MLCVCAAGAVVDAVKTGKLEHIFVIGGCDGSEPQRKYYDKLARLMPLNTMVSGCQQCGMCALLFICCSAGMGVVQGGDILTSRQQGVVVLHYVSAGMHMG